MGFILTNYLLLGDLTMWTTITFPFDSLETLEQAREAAQAWFEKNKGKMVIQELLINNAFGYQHKAFSYTI